MSDRLAIRAATAPTAQAGEVVGGTRATGVAPHLAPVEGGDALTQSTPPKRPGAAPQPQLQPPAPVNMEALVVAHGASVELAAELARAGVNTHTIQAFRGGVPTGELRALVASLRARVREPAVARVLPRLEAALAANPGNVTLPFARVAGVDPARPPSDRELALIRAQRLAQSYQSSTQIVLDSSHGSGFVEMYDGWGLSGRLRPNDAAAAILRANAAVWSVRDDIERGSAAPADFGVSAWADVTPERMMHVALARLSAGGETARRAIAGYLASPAYRRTPLHVLRDGHRVPLVEEPGFSSERGVGNYLFPAAHASGVARLGIMRAAEQAAIASAAERATPDDGNLQVVLSLWRGDGVPRDSSQALIAAATAARVPIARTEIVGTPQAPVTEERLKERVARGELAAYRPVPNMPGSFMTFTLRSPEEVAREIHQRAIDPSTSLSPATRQALREIVGPSEAPGRELARRMGGEENSRYWRTIGGEVVVAATFATASFITGGLAGAVAAGWGYSTLGVAAASLVAQSVTFSAASQIRQGEFRPTDFARDALLFAPLAGAQYASHMISTVVRGTSLPATTTRSAILYGGTAISTTGVLTTYEMGERYLTDRPVTPGASAESLQRNAVLSTSVMAVTIGLSRVMPGLSPQALVAAVGAPRLVRPTATQADPQLALAQTETVRDPVVIAEVVAGADRYSVLDNSTITNQSGQVFLIRAGNFDTHTFVASDAAGAMFIYEAGASGRARFRPAGPNEVAADGVVGLVDGLPTTRLSNGVVIGPQMTPLGVRPDGATALARLSGVDDFARSLIATEPLTAVTLPDGRVAHSSPSHFVTPEGRVLRFFAADPSGRRVMVDVAGAGYLVEPSGLHRPITEASLVAESLGSGFERFTTASSSLSAQIRNLRGDVGLADLPPAIRALVEAAPGINWDVGLGPRPSGVDLRVRQGRLVQVATRGAREVAFDVDGVPVEILPGPGSQPTSIAGLGPTTRQQFLVHQHGGRTAFWEAIPGAPSVYRARDGSYAIIRAGSADPPQRTGVVGFGPSLVRRTTHLLINGELYEAQGAVPGHPDMVYAVSATRDGIFRIRAQGAAATPVPARLPGTVRVVDDFGVPRRVYQDGEAYTIVADPATRSHFADTVFDAVSSRIELASHNVPLPSRTAVAAVHQAMTPDANGRYSIRPDLSDSVVRSEVLRNELLQGRGPFVEAILGRDGVRRLEAEVHFAPGDASPFILAVRSDAPAAARRPHEVWSKSAPFKPQRFGIFVDEGASVRPATIGEVRAAFDNLVGPRRGVAWRDLPRPDSVSIEPAPRAGERQTLVIRRGAETLRIPYSERPSTIDPSHFPTDAQMVRWLRELPFQSLRGLENIAFGQQPEGLALYSGPARLVSFAPHPHAWRGPLADVIAGHEIAGHNIERSSPALMRLLMLSAVLDRTAGSPHTARAYGEAFPQEYFATLIERYVAGDPTVAQQWPHFARVMGALFTSDGQPADPRLFRGAAQAMVPVVLMLMAAERERDNERSPQ